MAGTRWNWAVVGLVVLAALHGISCQARENGKAAAKLEVLTLTSKVFHNTRSIRVLLPPRYFDSTEKAKTYPVFYFTDGIAVFHGRELERIAGELMQAGEIPAMIFVGIDNGGSTRESRNPGTDRANEYLPFVDEFLQPPLPAPQGQHFPEFLEKEVRPLVESKYRTTKEIGLGGASYGAEIALYTAMTLPGHYRWLYLESPSLYVHNDELLRRAEKFEQWPERIYIGAGTAEGAKENEDEMVRDVKRLKTTVDGKTKSCLLIVAGAKHEESAWRERLPTALRFLLASGGCEMERIK